MRLCCCSEFIGTAAGYRDLRAGVGQRARNPCADP
jgi:hypothetical protein